MMGMFKCVCNETQGYKANPAETACMGKSLETHLCFFFQDHFPAEAFPGALYYKIGQIRYMAMFDNFVRQYFSSDDNAVTGEAHDDLLLTNPTY